jgi:hypothetical protein
MMNPTNQSPQESREDDHFAAVLAAVNTDAAPLDPDALARLREQSTAAFGAASHASEMKRPTFTRFERWLGAIAALVLVCIGFYFWFASNASAATLGQALDNAEKATTLQARLTVGKKQIESWHTTKPARSRWDDLDGNYRIADGKHLWIVNENINEARRAKADADAIRRPVHQLLNMLGLPKERANVLAALPVKQVRDGQNLVLVYRTEIDAPEGRIGLEALVIAKSHRIHSIRTWLDKAGKIEPLGELTVIAYDRPIPDEKFAIAATLT